jgi:hypothetical protein
VNLAILHYHLNRGGVTRVIENQLDALDAVLDPAEPWRVALVYGGRRSGWCEDLPSRLSAVELSLHEVPSLDYDQQRGNAGREQSDSLAGELVRLFRQIGFAPEDSILHVHNHALGKNVSLPGCVARLAAEGYPLVLQIHDFPEDLRPGNYRRFRGALARGRSGRPNHDELAAVLYPQTPHVHYAVLNGRDEQILRGAGVAATRLDRLPNPVPEMDQPVSTTEARDRLAQQFGVTEQQRLVLYPVRGIRRKNLGEALLYAALAPPETVLGLTLPPLNPAERPRYESWKRLARELDLPCRFELGAAGGLSFAENLAAADLICTTSLAEGFGMVFLESWLAGRPLVGRDLPEITRDFNELAVRFDWLSPRLLVPLAWIGFDAFRITMLGAYRRTLQAYSRPEPDHLAAMIEAKIDSGLVDFGDLDETLQQQVLRTVCRNDESRRCVLRHNAWIEQALTVRREEASAVIEANAQTIQQHFSRLPSGRRLLELYQQVASSPRDRPAEPLGNPERILDEFLDFRRFRPIRS